jgi:hypothetical protein
MSFVDLAFPWCMLDAVDPLLQRIEAVPEPSCYNVTFVLDRNHERSVIMKVSPDAPDGVHVPEANMIAGWDRTAESFLAVLAAVRAVDQARRQGGGVALGLRDGPGGWDVSVGNVVAGADGRPECVAHGPLEPAADAGAEADSAAYSCPVCGAVALFGGSST